MSPGDAGGSPQSTDPCEALLRRWQEEGDVEALDHLLREELGRLKQRIRRKGRAFLEGSATASDIAQEAALRLLRPTDPPRFESPRYLRAYLWRTAWNLLVDRLRRNRLRIVGQAEAARLEEAPAETRGLGAIDDEDEKRKLLVALNLLRVPEREILELRYFDGLDLRGIAERLDIARDAANMRLVRARRALATKLSGWEALIG